MKPRTLFTVLLLSGLFLFFQGIKTGNAAEFPSRPVEVIMSGDPGGTTDMAVRLMGEELTKALGVPAILTNKGGAGGAISAEYVAGVKPDGYTILATSGNVFTIIPVLNPKIHYKLSDFIPICKYTSSTSLFMVRNASPFKRFEDIISYAKKNPGKLTCASAGTGTTSHFALELVKMQAEIDVAHMPCRSGGEVITSLLGGHVDFATHSFSATLGLLKSGELRGMAGISTRKLPGFPSIPTLKELGYPPSIIYWMGYFVPKGTPKPIVDKLDSVFEKAMKSPTVAKNLENAGYILDYQDGPTLAKFIPEEYKLIEEISKKAKLIK